MGQVFGGGGWELGEVGNFWERLGTVRNCYAGVLFIVAVHSEIDFGMNCTSFGASHIFPEIICECDRVDRHVAQHAKKIK